MDERELMEKAGEAMLNAYAPYSKFKVGAAVLTKDGNIYTGCNIEHFSFSLTVCAERVAVFKAISEGDELDSIAIASENGNSSPCGACRQVIFEFNPLAKVYYLKDGNLIVSDISQLLPDAFDLRAKND